MTTRQDIVNWLEQGKKQKFLYCIIVCDTFDWTDYPIFSHSKKDMLDKVRAYDNIGKMTRVIEVYDLTKPFDPQLHEYRCRVDLRPL